MLSQFIRTVLCSERSISSLVIFLRKDLKHQSWSGKEQQQHRLKAVRGQEDVCVVQMMHQGAGRATRLVHQNLIQEKRVSDRV